MKGNNLSIRAKLPEAIKLFMYLELYSAVHELINAICLTISKCKNIFIIVDLQTFLFTISSYSIIVLIYS